MDSLNEKLMQIQDASNRAARWIADHQHEDGSLSVDSSVIESSYKGAWAFNIAGYGSNAHRLANYISKLMNDDGDTPIPREEQAFLNGHYLYANGYMSIGFRLIGRFELAEPMMNFIQSRQVPKCGGFYSFGPQVNVPVKRLDTVSTSISLLSAVYAGRLEVAVRSAEYLKTVFLNQPDSDRYFYPTTDIEGALLLEPEVGMDHIKIDIRDPEQDWYFIGLPSLVLAELYLATGDRQYLDLSINYTDYIDQKCDEGALSDFSSGKTAVAAAHLYRLTGNKRYLEIVFKVLDFISAHQGYYGFWCESSDSYPIEPEKISWSDMDMSLEYILWLKMIGNHLRASSW